MLKNYVKSAWRNLQRNRFYSIINIAGLAVGLAVGILILLWVQDELTFDNFHRQAANIYRLELFGGTGASRQIWSVDVAPIGPLAKKQLPEVRDQVRVTGNYDFSLYKFGDKVFGEGNVAYADPSLFSVFDFPLIQGSAARPFKDDNSVVITRQTAEKFFGNEDPIGKVIQADNKVNFTVTGVMENFPKNSSISYSMIMPMAFHVKSMLANKVDLNSNFTQFNYVTYLLLKPGTSLESLSQKLFQIHISHKSDDTDVQYLLLPLSKLHLYNADGTDKGIGTVRIFIVIGLLILIIACINYVNLSIARSLTRTKEISMRKIIGAVKIQLFLQFMVETALLFSLAAVVALGLVYVLMPLFNQMAGKHMELNLADYHIWVTIVLTNVCSLAAASIYPALQLSDLEPLKAFKGKITSGMGSVLFRKILVVTQFVFSVVLIVGTIVITSQLHFIRSKDLGYDKTHVFSFWMRDMSSHYQAVKAELLKQPSILGVTRADQNIVTIGGLSGDNDWDGKAPNQTFILHPMGIDEDFMPFFKMKFAEGSGFTGAVSDTTHLILNEAAVKEIGLKNPIGKRFRMWKIKGTIIGIVKDFHFASMKEKIGPAVFYYYPENYQTIYVKTRGDDAQSAIRASSEQFKQYNGEYPFSFAFLEDTFDNLYQGEQREGTLFNYFASIAIFISCLGLLGLGAYTAQVRTREIGVRKVLGASVSGIVLLLSRDFIKLVLIAICIAIPLAWYSMNQWLESFAYRISVSWWMFALAALLAIIIALITVSFQAIKAAVANPVNSLKTE